MLVQTAVIKDRQRNTKETKKGNSLFVKGINQHVKPSRIYEHPGSERKKRRKPENVRRKKGIPSKNEKQKRP